LRNNASFHTAIEFKEMAHDELDGVFVNMVVFPTVAEISLAAEWLVNGGHFKCRKIMNIIMSQCKFISSSAQGGFGVTAGTDDIQILAERGPQADR
jgi:hypothetical protein